jgi:hypothetical protein
MTHPKLDARGNFEVITAEPQRAEPGKVIVTALAGLFFVICTWTSYAHRANFQYRSFDLAADSWASGRIGRKRSAAGQPRRTDRFSFCSALRSFSSSDAFCYRAECCARDHASGWLQHRKATRTDGKRDCLLCAALLLASAAGYIAIHEFRCPKLWSRPSFC